MMHTARILIATLPILSLVTTADAQFPGRSGDDRGSDRGRFQDFRRDRSDDRDRDDRDNDDRDRDDDGDSRGDGGARGGWGSRGGWGGGSDRGFGRGGDDDSDRSRGRFSGGFGGPPGGFGGGFGGPPGGFRPDPGAIFDRIDRDGDGRLGGEEVEGMSGFFRGMLDRAGIGEGASRDDFSRGMERMREERERGESDDRNGDRDDRNRSAENNYYKPAERQRITLEIPDDFRGRDLDGDGQIGFYEWREWDRTRTDEFLLIDMNGDGFLTPKELADAAGLSSGDGWANDDGRSNERESGSSGSGSFANGRDFNRGGGDGNSFAASRNGGSPASEDRSASGFDEDDPRVSKGRGYFKLLDTNNDANVNPDEWSASRRLKPLFEEAGARLDRDMSQTEFLTTYLKTDG